MTSLPGIGGSLFPSRFLTDVLAAAPTKLPSDPHMSRRRRQFLAWWTHVDSSCGPATGLRTLFDVVAMPLFALLGYRARDASFARSSARAFLDSRAGVIAALILMPWATRPSLAWRDAVAAARSGGCRWAFVLAPPYLSLIDARGHSSRRALEVALPPALDERSFPLFLSLASVAAFHPTTAAGAPPIEALVDRADTFQDQVREDLQQGVVRALAALGPALWRSTAARFDEALTIVYRVLFLLFAESRGLVPSHHPIYARAYTVSLLCREAMSAEPPAGLWEGLAAITRLSRHGVHADDLIVCPFNGALFARASAPSLEGRWTPRRYLPTAASRDTALRSALVALGSRPGAGGREEIAYADLGVEQLGAVYERVLDIDPAIVSTAIPVRPALRRHSHRRKESGTFYTPRSLAEFVVRRTLEPLVAGTTADRIASLRLIDPAMGSGAFLVAACRFLASAYEHALIEEGRCAEGDLDADARADIRRLIAERCLAGVDVNPVAVQLARLSIWLTSLARGKPLGFLDHRLRVGNSLIGCGPDDLSRLTGRSPQSTLPLFEAAGLDVTLQRVLRPLSQLMATRDDTVEQVRSKETWWKSVTGGGSPIEPWRLACHIWCSRWFTGTRMTSPAETRTLIDAALARAPALSDRLIARHLESAREQASAQRFFHWPLEFADVFYDDGGEPKAQPGFDAVIGNPPWEMMRHDTEAPHQDFTALIRFIRESGLYPSCSRGHVNLYQPFVDRALALVRPGGRIGLVLPWGIASDDGAAALRARLLDRDGLSSIAGIDNSGGIFPIHRGVRFLVLNATAAQPSREISARFGIRQNGELDELPGRDTTSDPSFPIRLTATELRRVGGTSGRIPDVRRASDYALLDRLTRAFPRLGSVDGWRARFGRELNATDDRDAFGDSGLPVLEGKHIRPFVVETSSRSRRIERATARERLPHLPFDAPRLAYRDVSAVANRMSLIAAILPAGVVTTHTLFCLKTPIPLERQHYLCGLFNSYVLNAVVRMLMGGHVTTSLVEDLPVPRWDDRLAETHQVAELARQLSNGNGSSQTMALLQAAAARVYGLGEEEFASVLELFPLIALSERKLAADAFMEPEQPYSAPGGS